MFSPPQRMSLSRHYETLVVSKLDSDLEHVKTYM